MNQKPTPERLAYRQKQLAELDKVLPALGPEIRRIEDLPEDSRLAEQHAAATAHRIRKKPVLDQTHTQRPPEKLPDPWLFDSQSLLRELDRCRELVLQIPIADHHATQPGSLRSPGTLRGNQSASAYIRFTTEAATFSWPPFELLAFPPKRLD